MTMYSRPDPQTGGPHSNEPTKGLRRARFWEGMWYFVVVIISAGVLAAIPFAHAARRLRRSALWRWTAVYGAVGLALIILIAVTPTDTQSQAVGPADQAISTITGFLILATVVAGCIQLRTLRREVYGFPARPVPGPPTAGVSDPAVAAVLAARARRQEARELAARDPLLARDLHIGRPDLPHPYDDGGLVDLNTAPAQVIVQVCEVDAVIADKIVATRNQLGGSFSNLDELFVLADLPTSTWDRLRDRTVLLPG